MKCIAIDPVRLPGAARRSKRSQVPGIPKKCAQKWIAGAADVGNLAGFAVLSLVRDIGEGRENRPQLRCGNASQTSTARRTRGQSQSAAKPVKAEARCSPAARKCQTPNFQIPGNAPARWPRPILGSGFWSLENLCAVRADMRSPNIHPRTLTRVPRNFCARRLAKTSSQK